MVKNRGRNFIRSEANLLFDIMERYIMIVENKRTDAISTQEKNRVWKHIGIKFNDVSHYEPRTVHQLRTFYDNFKRKTRKDLASTKTEFGLQDNITRLTDETEVRFLNMLKNNIEQMGSVNEGASTSYAQVDVIDYHIDSPSSSIEQEDSHSSYQEDVDKKPDITLIQDSLQSPDQSHEYLQNESTESTPPPYRSLDMVRLEPIVSISKESEPHHFVNDELTEKRKKSDRYKEIKLEIKQAVLKRKLEEIEEGKELRMIKKRYMLNKITIQENKILKQELELRQLKSRSNK